MTKRRLYAQLAVVLLTAILPRLSSSQPAAGGAPCGSCLGITIQGGQKLLLPEELAGITVLLRTSMSDPMASDVLSEIRRHGGRPAVLVEPFSAAAPVPDNLSYRLKSFLTQLRGHVPEGVPIALDASHPGVEVLLPEIAPYVDVVVAAARLAEPGRRVWPLLDTTDPAVALRATSGGGFERWVVRAPADAIAARMMIHTIVNAAKHPPDTLFEDVEVSVPRRLTADEIVARHQAVARRQTERVTRTISSGTLTLTFEAPGFPAPVTITADTTLYVDRDMRELAQRDIRVNGIVFKTGAVPRLPILEPERVASPPLTITLGNVYRYRLAGEDTVDGFRCYAIDFEPLDSSRSLFRGRAWIAVDGFAMVKVAATQTALRGAIVSSEQVDEFRQAATGVWLLARSDVRQIYEGASHRTPIHRVLAIDANDIDPADFDARRQAAYASNALLLRDTPEGYRYLRRVPPEDRRAGAPPAVEVAGAATRVRTIAAGVIIDPNISRPLPFAGLNYVDFDLFGTGAQLNAFFGGGYGQLAFSAPSVAGTRWQLGGRAFAIASSYNDRAFRAGREIYEENLRQRPAYASAWLLRPLGARTALRMGYAFEYTRLRAAPETATDFAVPPDQVVHVLQLSLEAQRAGWAGSLWWHPARRAGWEQWGREAYDQDTSDFSRYGVTVSRATVISPSLVTRFEAQWMDGHDLDRFSRYTFGTFDNRLRGYPSALVRYDRGAVVRGAVAWSVSRVARLDAFLDTAAVRDPGYGEGLRNYTGVGLAAETPVPFGMLAALEWGYGFRGVNADGGRGTHVIRVSAFKVF
jgi:hypothetical protein